MQIRESLPGFASSFAAALKRAPHGFRGGGNRVRTGDPELAKLVLCQLSYAPMPRRLSLTRPAVSKNTHAPKNTGNGVAFGIRPLLPKTRLIARSS